MFFEDLIVVVSGRRPVKPIYVIRAGAEGDITLDEGTPSNDSVVWSLRGRDSYIPSPWIMP